MTAGIDVDISETVYAHFPRVIGASAGLVFVLMTLSFRSVVLATKSVVTITITLSLVYGLAKFVYQDGVLTWALSPSAPLLVLPLCCLRI